MKWFARWRPLLRIARRDAWQHKGRSAVVVVMVALPVLGVVAADTLARTADVSTVEGLDRNLGSADAQVIYSGSARIRQSPDELNYDSEGSSGGDDISDAGPASRLAALLPTGSRTLEVLRGSTEYATTVGRSMADAVETDLADPMTKGLYRVTAGRAPRAADEVAVSKRVAARGYSVGSRLTLADGSARTVVGLIDWLAFDSGTRLVVGTPGSTGLQDDAVRWWLVDTTRGLTWPQVKALNGHGYAALSRAVVTKPPPTSAVDMPDYGGGMDAATVGVLGMIVAMALLEVVLLAGPAFAVGVRRRQRSLALLSATGGRPRDVRRVVLSGGIVLGGVASLIGVAGGLVGARLALPAVQQASTSRFGPFDYSLRDMALLAAFGLLSAVLAAVVPAFAAARQDVVAVLAGRRGQTRTPIWSPVLGVVLLGTGIAFTVLGATRGSGGETLITGGAIPAVLGMVLLIPLVVSQLGRLAGALPLAARFAVRDAARHRSRTAPAVAAVAATVAGVVALGIGGASDGAQSKALHNPMAPLGAGVVQVHGDRPADWDAVAAVVTRQLPGAHITRVLGVADPFADGVPDPASSASRRQSFVLEVNAVAPKGVADAGLSWSSNFGASVLVGRKTFDALGLQIPEAQRDRARRALAAGKVVLFANADVAARVMQAKLMRQALAADGSGEVTTERSQIVPAVAVTAPGTTQPAAAIVPESAATRLGFTTVTTALLVDGVDITTDKQDTLDEALGNFGDTATLGVERGYHDNTVAVTLLLLGCVGGVLVLGGTLTATFLALSDARPDFATMGAVGAAPRTRRAVAASYAATIGLVGAALGAIVGFIPGIAVTYPLTSASWAAGSVDAAGVPIADHFLDIPWLLIVCLVVGLPLLTATVVGLTTRSRLPMVSRLS